jgi:hypothetical protein
MKANRVTPPPPAFEPVVVTLESQQEVDELYALLNCIQLAAAIPTIGYSWKKLKPFASHNAWHVHNLLCELLK